MNRAPAYGYQPGAVPVGSGGDCTGIPEGVTPAAWFDPPPSIQCEAVKKNGDPCGAHKVEGTPFCVGHVRGWRKKVNDGEDALGD